VSSDSDCEEFEASYFETQEELDWADFAS